MKAYYNEFDPKAAAWLRELIAQGHIPSGDVDTRSITEISPHELSGYTQKHFFAGIGGWAYALRLAGWTDDRPVCTGSCPCQPFSAAGKQLGTSDSRHLWPVFRDLITFGEASVTFGEQVASKLGREWLAGVRADLEGLGYAVGAADLCAAGAGAPHIRQRLFWVADADSKHAGARRPAGPKARVEAGIRGANGSVADTNDHGFNPASGREFHDDQHHVESRGQLSGVCHPASEGRGQAGCDASSDLQADAGRSGNRPGDAGPNDFWRSSQFIACTDGKARRIEPGSFPLAHGVSGRVGLLRGYGNAIVPQVAAQFVKAFMDTATT